MSYTITICPSCQGEIHTYFGPEGMGGICPNCGCTVGTVLDLEPRYKAPTEAYETIQLRFLVQKYTDVRYHESCCKFVYPIRTKNIDVVGMYIEKSVPEAFRSSRKVSNKYCFEQVYAIDEYLHSMNIDSCGMPVSWFCDESVSDNPCIDCKAGLMSYRVDPDGHRHPGFYEGYPLSIDEAEQVIKDIASRFDYKLNYIDTDSSEE